MLNEACYSMMFINAENLMFSTQESITSKSEVQVKNDNT
jgi:hypothetical protein